MLFYMILVFFHFQSLVKSSELPVDSIESNETKLAIAVMNFKKQLDGKPDDSCGTGSTCSGDPQEITKEVMDVFKDVIHGLLAQVSNIHYGTLLDKPTAMALKEKEKQKIYTYVFEETDFEIKICWRIPRCLDFIYNFSTDITGFFELYRSYSSHCVNWKGRVHQQFSWNSDVNQYSYSLDQVIKLHDFVSEYPNQPMCDGYAETGTRFMENVFEYINGIDKVKMLRTNRRIDRPIKGFGDDTRDDFLNLRRKFAEYKLKDEENSKLEQVLQKLNKDFGRAISEKSTGSPPPTVADAVNRLVTRAFRMLRVKFKSEIENALPVEKGTLPEVDDDVSLRAANRVSTKDVGKYSRLDFIRAVENIFKGFCDQAPLIVIYAMGNCSEMEFNSARVPYGLQLAYCSHWRDVLRNRCPTNDKIDDAQKERTCMVKTISDVLDVNDYWTTGGEESPEHNVEHEKSASGYLSAVHRALVEHYLHRGAAPEPAFLVWSTADWMTGRYFLNNNQIKTFQTPLTHIDGSTAVVALADLYVTLMPWITSVDTVFPYRGAITEAAERVMDDFVLKHAILIELYAKSEHGTDDAEQLKRLSRTIRWYVDGAKTFFEYLSVPGPRAVDSVERWTVEPVVAAIAKLGDENASLDGFVRDMTAAVPVARRDDIDRWAKDKIGVSDRYQIRLNRLILENCHSADKYVKFVHHIAHVSGLGVEETPTTIDVAEQQHCLPCLKDIFATETVDAKKDETEEQPTKVDVKTL